MVDITFVNSPLGKIGLSAEDDRLIRIFFDVSGLPEQWQRNDRAPVLVAAAEQLAAYFNGGLKRFDLPLAPRLTAFEADVLAEAARIPYGATASYGQLAAALGKPRAARAVGNALHKNPLPIVLPCHRVVTADGRINGYAYGLERKRLLLELEKSHA